MILGLGVMVSNTPGEYQEIQSCELEARLFAKAKGFHPAFWGRVLSVPFFRRQRQSLANMMDKLA